MPDDTNQTDIQVVWMAFARSTGALLVPSPDDRPLDQFAVSRQGVDVGTE